MSLTRFSKWLALCFVLQSAGSSLAQSPAPLTINSVVLRAAVEAETPARQLGVLARTLVDEGAMVQADDVLAALDDRTAKLAVQKAALERDQARAKVQNDLTIQYADKALEVARAEMQRSIESNAQFANSISQSQLDVERLTIEKLELERKQAERDMESARFDLQLKETALEAAQLELELHSVRAPFAGVVALVRGRVGEWVQPGAPVVRLVAIDVLRAEGFVPTQALGEVGVGATVRFVPQDGRPDATNTNAANADAAAGYFEGKVGFISPETDPVTHQVRVWAEIDNRDHRLRPGQQGQMLISPRAAGEAK